MFCLLLSLANISSLAMAKTNNDQDQFFKIGELLKNFAENTWQTLSVEWTGRILIIVPSIFFIYKSVGEIFTTIVNPANFHKSKKYQLIFTTMAIGPLFFTFLNKLFINSAESNDTAKNQFKIESSTHYLAFQLYFLIGNIVASKFFHKFLVPTFDFISTPSKIDEKVFSKLLRWHYLGWSSFFLLSFFLPIWVLVITILVVFSNSTLAFLFGRQFGKNQFSKFSIFKSVEGFGWSTLISTVVFSFSSVSIFRSEFFGTGMFGCHCRFGFWIYMLVGIIFISLVSHIGENTFGVSKRLLGYKNFGRLFGTKIGGFWDRFDGISVTLFFVGIAAWASHAVAFRDIGIKFV
ncbi:diacylglycerol/polyprenol kinase family protein [Mycoplasma parvum]|uniref:hypothetical protein n=1 Tax=Mycoplasma parvum TaxID=984991 RepID=UPI0003F5B40D|nr:hypothetical protein [Mycoplasma parvum]